MNDKTKSIDFDIAGARKEGATDKQISDYFKSTYDVDFDVEGARKEGATDDQILDYINANYGQKKNETSYNQPTTDGKIGGTVGASDVQSTESETGLFAPLQVPKMFAEKTLKVKETPAPKGQYTLEREGQKANITRDDIFKNLENEEFLKGVKSGEVKVDIQDDEALGNLLNEKLNFFKPQERYAIDGQEVSQQQMTEKLYDRDFVNKLQQDQVKLEFPETDTFIADLTQKQKQSGGELMDKWESIKEGAFRMASGVAGLENYVKDFLRLIPIFADVPETASEQLSKNISKELQVKAEQEAGKIRQYEDDFVSSIQNGNYIDAVSQAGNVLSSSVAPIVATMATGGATGIAPMAAIYASGEYAGSEGQEKLSGEKLTQGERIASATISGTAESVLGTFPTSRIVGNQYPILKEAMKHYTKKAFGIGGTKAAEGFAEEAAKKTVLGVVKDVFKDPALEVGGETLNAGINIIKDVNLGIRDPSAEEIKKELVNTAALSYATGQTLNIPSSATSIKKYIDQSLVENPNVIKDDIKQKAKEGKITEAEAQQATTNIEKREKAINAVPNDLKDNVEVVDKIEEKQALEEEIKNLDPIFQGQAQEQINEKIKELETLTSGTTTTPAVTQKEATVEVKKPIAEMKGESVTVNLGGKAISGIVEVDEGGKAQIFSGNQIFELPADVEYSEYVSPVRLADNVDGIEVNGEVYAEVRFEVKDNQEVALLIKEDGTLVTMRVPAIVEELKYQSALAQMEEMGEQELNQIYNTYESERKTTPTAEEGVSETDGTAPAETEQDIRLQEAIEEIDLIEQIALEQIEQAEGASKLVQYKPKGSKDAKVYLVTKNADGSYSATVDGKKVVNKNVLSEIGKKYEATTKQEVNSLIPKLQEQTNNLKQEVENKLFGVTTKIEQDAKITTEQPSSQMREQSVQETAQRTSDSDMPIVNEAELQDRQVVEEEVKKARRKKTESEKEAQKLREEDKKALKRLEPDTFYDFVAQWIFKGGKVTLESLSRELGLIDPKTRKYINSEIKPRAAIWMNNTKKRLPDFTELPEILRQEYQEWLGIDISESEARADVLDAFRNIRNPTEAENYLIEKYRTSDRGIIIPLLDRIEYLYNQEQAERAKEFEQQQIEELTDKEREEMVVKFIDNEIFIENLATEEEIAALAQEFDAEWAQMNEQERQNLLNQIEEDEKSKQQRESLIPLEQEDSTENVRQEKPSAREGVEKRLAEAKAERVRLEESYNKAKESYDKDLKAQQADMFAMGKQQGFVNDLAEKKAEVDRRKKLLDAAIEKEQNIQGLLDDNLKGQKSLLDRLENLKIKGGDQTGALMLAPKLFNGFIDAIKAGVKAGMILGDAIKKGIDYLKANGVTDVEPYLNEIEINTKEPNLKREIQKLIKRKPTEQKRIDKAYALGVADTKETFKAKLDEMKSDFKEFLGFQAEQTKQAVQAEKAKGESKLSQERYMKKQITDLIKSALDKDFISQRTFETIMNRLGKAKTPTQYQKLFDYISKAAEQADYAERMSEVSRLQSQANKRNHTSLTKAVKDFTSINPELIPDNLLPQYIKALDELGGRVPSYQTMQDIYLQVMASKQPPKAFDEITTLAKAQELYNQIGLNQVKNVEEYVNLFKDINSFKRKILQLIDSEIDPTIIQGYEQMLEDVGKDQQTVEAKYATEIEAIKKEMIADLRNSINSTSTVGQTPPEKALLSDFFDLTDAELENLSPEELYNLQSILDNVKEYGYVDVFRLNPLVIKAKTYGKPTTELTNQIRKAKSFNEAFKDKFEAVRKLGGTFSSFWETTLGLQNLGMGAFTKYIAAPMEKAVASYRREVENAYSDYVKIKEKYGIQNDKPFGIKKTLMDKTGKETNQMTKLGMISTYLREYAMSFDEKYAGKKDADQMTFGTRDWFAEILSDPKKRSSYTKEEIDRIREVHDKLPKVNGKVDVKAVWDSYVNGTTEFLTKNEMGYLKEVNQWKEKNITDKQKYANELRGKPFDELLFHIKRMRKEGGKSQSDPVEISGKNNNVRIAAGSGKEVTNNNVGAIEVDFEKIFTESVEETYRDFYMTPFLQEQSALLNNVEKNIPKDKYEYVVTTKENLQAALNNEFGSPTIKGYENIIRNLTLAKAAQVLIAPIRTGYEMISSYISYPFRAGALSSFSETFRNKDAVKKLLEFTNSPLLNKADVNKHFDVVKGNVEGKGMLEKAIDFFAAMPERNMVNLVWMASFDNEFKKITGKDFDRTRINDKAYLRENKKSIEEAGAISDMVYQQISGATTSAGTRRFALPQGKIAKALGLEGVTAKSTGGQIITFFTNYPFRETEQWLKSARGIKDIAKDRNVTSENAKYVLYPIVGTFLGASLYQFMQALGFQAKNYLTALYGDDDEEEEKAKIEIERITSPEGIMNEMIAGTASTAGTRYGAITKAALQLAGTMIYNLSDNEKLREKGKAITRELTFKNPLELRKKDGTINTYGLKGEIASQITSYIPFVQVIVDNALKAADGVGGLEYLYDKVEKGERLTDDEKDAIIAVQSVINITNLFINFTGKAVPFTSEIERLGREIKKEQKQTKKQGSTLGTVIETSDRQTTERQTTERQATPREAE